MGGGFYERDVVQHNSHAGYSDVSNKVMA